MSELSLKSQYLDGVSGLTQKLLGAYELGRRFIRPQFDNIPLKDAVSIATVSPHITLANTASNAEILAGYTVHFDNSGVEAEFIIASPVVLGSTLNTTTPPASPLSGKSLRYSSPRPAAYTQIATELAAAAAAGKSQFSITVETADSPAYLRLKGNYMNAYFAGIQAALSKEGFFPTYEVAVSLDTSDTLATKVKFQFTFC